METLIADLVFLEIRVDLWCIRTLRSLEKKGSLAGL